MGGDRLMGVYLGTEKISVYTGGIIVKNSGQYVWEKYEFIPPYLSFLGNEDFTLKTYNTTKNWDGTLEYSTDKTTWNTWNGTEISSSGSKLYLRGIGNTKITGNSNNYRFVFTGTSALKIACEGNIENLLDYKTVSAGVHPTMANYCYNNMFYGCTALTTAPELPATTLSVGCYQCMFQGCTSLTSAPSVLPATTLGEGCYNYMFYGCASLTTAPELPATTLTRYCYECMFSGCTSLTTAPELPATTLASNCYSSMFSGCTSLTTAPELPATTLAGNCYKRMFYGCTSLTKASELPATMLAEYCYESMFNRCTSLTKAPSVFPATTLANNCYQFMFEFTAINAIPRIMATTYATDSCKGMFDDIKTLNVYSTSGTGHIYGWTAPSSASTYCSGMFGSDDGESEWAKLDGSNFPNSGTPTDGTTYYFKTVA